MQDICFVQLKEGKKFQNFFLKSHTPIRFKPSIIPQIDHTVGNMSSTRVFAQIPGTVLESECRDLGFSIFGVSSTIQVRLFTDLAIV